MNSCDSFLAKCLFLGILFLPADALFAGNYQLFIPPAVQACLNRTKTSAPPKLERLANPYYHRGDFDGDGRMDYAVWIRGRTTGKGGIIICHASGLITVLGGDTVHRPPFSDLPGDQFLSSNWWVISQSEAMARIAKGRAVGQPAGEALLMQWGDGAGLVYFDGTRYRWGNIRSAER